MSFLETIFQKLKRHPKRIVFPEGADPRVLHAARAFYEKQLGVPILLGRKDVIAAAAKAEKVSLDRVGIIDPSTSEELPGFCERFAKIERYRKFGVSNVREIMVNANYFGAMMLQYGLADGLVGGVSDYSGALLRPVMQVVSPLPNTKVVSGCMIIDTQRGQYGDEGILFFADCSVIPKPTMEQLAAIAFQTGLLARQVFGKKPRIALLSFSTKGSVKTPETEKIAAAAALAKQLASKALVEMEIDGELQADTALLPNLAGIKAPGSAVAGRANVLIFPELNSGNIAYKLLRYLGGASVYGRLLCGLSRPAAEVSRGSTAEDIMSVAALAGLQAIEYRRLYPADEDASDEFE